MCRETDRCVRPQHSSRALTKSRRAYIDRDRGLHADDQKRSAIAASWARCANLRFWVHVRAHMHDSPPKDSLFLHAEKIAASPLMGSTA